MVNSEHDSPKKDSVESDNNRYSESDYQSQSDKGYPQKEDGHEYDYDELDASTEVSYTSRDPMSGGINNVIFSQDFLPDRYDRHSYGTLPLKFICFLELAIDFVLVIVFIYQGIHKLKSDSSWFLIAQYSLAAVTLVLALIWLNYKLHLIFCSIYRLFIDLDCIKNNNKYYSGLEIPDFFVQQKEFPPITIQIPVYKENLLNTIKPTLLNCCREADRYMQETGAVCNIIICDDGYNLIPEADRLERVALYRDLGVGFTARPHPSKHPRMGRFKKAGNLNFSMNYGGGFHDPDESPEALRKRCEDLVAKGAAFGGDTRYGDYILLIDSDTRLPIIPMKENGCLKRLAKEMIFDGEEVSFIQCYTGPYMSIKSSAEKSVFHHTCNIYNSILISTAFHSMAPLVGHNAFLNMKALIECARIDEDTGYYNFWAEDRISEDFDLMMRGCENGYTGRYASHTGIFLEGVSFSYMTEYFKISKFACGAAELIYNPMSEWCKKGVLSSTLISFVKSEQVEWYNKMYIISYILNFIAIAAAHFALIFNVFFCEWLYKVLPTVLIPVNLMWEAIFIWTVLGGTLNFLFGARLEFNKWLLLKQTLREIVFLSCLYGSISVRFSVMSMTHLFNWNLSFGATAKDDEKVTLMDWIRSTPIECTVYTFYTAMMMVKLLFLTPADKLHFVIYFGCTPMMWNIFLFWAGPIFFDILPTKVDKRTDESYQEDEKMFTDKYFTQVPNSSKIQGIKVGSSTKLGAGAFTTTGSQIAGTSVYSARSRSERSSSFGSNQSSTHDPYHYYPNHKTSNTTSSSNNSPVRIPRNPESFGVERSQTMVGEERPSVVV